MEKFYRSNTHPYEKVWTSEDSEFGYLRISKNGSTTFSDTFNLNKIVDIHKFKQPIYCALRNPYDRFISSILETIKRISYSERAIRSPLDVLVSKKIFESVLNLEFNNTSNFITEYIKLIDCFGFFDAHHEPQYYFLLSPEFKVLSDIDIFPLYDMRNQIEKINYKYKPISYNYSNKNSRKLNQNYKSMIINRYGYFVDSIKGKNISGINNKEILEFSKKYFVYENNHPIVKLTNKTIDKPYVAISNKLLNYLLASTYKSLKKASESNYTLKKFVEKKYELDIDIFNKLENIYNGETVNLKKLIT
jgi:hypothetical protein